MPEGAADGILRGMYLLREGAKSEKRVQLLGSGSILREVIAAAELLESDWKIGSDIWSVTSFNELQRDGVDTQRYNLLHPGEKAKQPYAQRVMGTHKGPAVAATDYIRLYSESIRPYLGDRRYVTLGTDGYGRSDFRRKLREFFEVNRYYVTIAALNALADEGTVDRKLVGEAIKKYGINPDKPNPVSV